MVADVKKDSVFDHLTKSDENDGATGELLRQMFANIQEVMDRQLCDQLPGGQYFDPSQELVEQSQSCNVTNLIVKELILKRGL